MLSESIDAMVEYVRPHFRMVRQVRPKLSYEVSDQMVQIAAFHRGKLAGPWPIYCWLSTAIISRSIGNRRSTDFSLIPYSCNF